MTIFLLLLASLIWPPEVSNFSSFETTRTTPALLRPETGSHTHPHQQTPNPRPQVTSGVARRRSNRRLPPATPTASPSGYSRSRLSRCSHSRPNEPSGSPLGRKDTGPN